jgi:hypothetical protein
LALPTNSVPAKEWALALGLFHSGFLGSLSGNTQALAKSFQEFQGRKVIRLRDVWQASFVRAISSLFYVVPSFHAIIAQSVR